MLSKHRAECNIIISAFDIQIAAAHTLQKEKKEVLCKSKYVLSFFFNSIFLFMYFFSFHFSDLFNQLLLLNANRAKLATLALGRRLPVFEEKTEHRNDNKKQRF
jgi:hypothetical protein